MGIAQQQQQAAQAQAQMQMQQEHQRQSMMQQMNQQRDNQILQQRQAQQSHNLQVEQSNVQMLNQYKQQQQAWRAEVGSIQNRHSADKLSYQRSREQYEKQIKNNAEGANRVYMQEQAKVTEVKKAAAFKMQENLAKAIGTEGTILASGRTGQSVGLLVNDVNRQMGFQQAQELAMMDSKEQQAHLQMDTAWIQANSANNQALGQVGWNPADPYMPEAPKAPTFVEGIGLGYARQGS